MTGQPEPGAAMTADQAKEAIEAGALLLDVRGPDEWRAGYAPQALHIPLDDLSARLAEVPKDRDIITVCRSGRRSAIAAEMLADHGLHATNLTGGLKAWVAAGSPIVSDNGTAHIA